MKRKTTFLLLLLALSWSIKAQTIHKFTQGLVATSVHRYGRQAIVVDPLAHQLHTNTWKQPKAGQVLFTDEEGNDISWEAIETDTAGNFRGRELSNGYLYLTYDTPQAQSALMHVSGNYMFYMNGVPHTGDIYGDDWLYVPVKLKKGTNEILIRCSRWSGWRGMAPELIFPEKPISLNTGDPTLPHVVLEENNGPLWGAVVVTNNTDKPLTNLSITTQLEGQEMTTDVPLITPQNFRKVGFQFDPKGITEKNSYTCTLQLKQKGKLLDEQTITIDAVHASEHHSYTFISDIDGSVQYYAVAPATDSGLTNPALFLSVHGAGVEAIGQARAYEPKDWGVLVAPTNRRPRGFNWEDWGRLDAMEVFELAKERYTPDPKRIYLTGHSMGGHGTWFLGATYAGKWAAIAPCAGYPTLTGYGSADGQIPEEGYSDLENLLLRASDPSNVIELAKNYKAGGVYIHHGDSDKVVPVTYARQMRGVLSEFHPDFSYYEYPGGSHWFSNQSVDWPPLFEYFKWHTIPDDSAVNVINFSTANPGISAQHRWATIMQQQHALEYSRMELARDKQNKTITGTTENIATLKISLADFKEGDTVRVELDGNQAVEQVIASDDDELYLHFADQWQAGEAPATKEKSPTRGGTFKEPFNHQMVFVYSTKGNQEENEWSYNKARFDAQVWYYRANGAVDIVADKDFNPADYPDRGVIVYGNATTNASWKKLLSDCPVQVQRGSASVGDQQYTGDNIGAYFMWPRPDSETASVAVISGTGVSGMRSTEANQYFAGGSGFPDYIIFSADMLKDGASGLKMAGFYGNDWTLESGDWAE